MHTGNQHRCQNKIRVRAQISEKSGILATLFLILFPKCFFCVAAYSGAIAMCSGKSFFTHSETSWLAFSAVSIVIIAGVIANFRGRRTWHALTVVLFGIILTALALIQQSKGIYYLGGSLLLVGIWLNGSLLYFLRYLKKIFQTLNINLQ